MIGNTPEPPPPILDPRDQAEVWTDLVRDRAGFTPEWQPVEGSPSTALTRVYARYSEILIAGLNQLPERSKLAMLDMLGARLLSAQAARAPLVFSLLPTAPVDVPLPANSLAAARVPPAPPSPLPEADTTLARVDEVVFATEESITITRAKLAALYSILPLDDSYADHSAALLTGFQVLAAQAPVEHSLYLGHDTLFALAGTAEIRLSFDFGSAPPAGPIHVDWEYLSKNGWLPLDIVEDRTKGFTVNEVLLLEKSCYPDAKKDKVNGQESYWIRGRLATPLPPEGTGEIRPVPVIDTIRARVAFTKAGLDPEAAFADAFKLDVSNNFLPFGAQPAQFSTLFIANKEAFGRAGARVSLNFDFATNAGASANIRLAWEYYNGSAWTALPGESEFTDQTGNFTTDGAVSFLAPRDWTETAVQGTKNLWLRARIELGDYGTPLQLKVTPSGSTYTVEAQPSTLKPPVVKTLTLSYTYQTEAAPLDRCLAYNNFVFEDDSLTCRWPRSLFRPFAPLEDVLPAVYFGFDQPLPVGLVSLYVSVAASTDEQPDDALSSFVWEYESVDGWIELVVLDETRGFRNSGLIQFIGPGDAIPVAGLGGSLYRLRARLKPGERAREASIAGIWLNAVWGAQRFFFERDQLGASDGNPSQTFSFLRRRGPVLEGEGVEVREWRGSGDDWETAVQDVPESDRRIVRDAVSGLPVEVWVSWSERPHLYSSEPGDRHYVVERTGGLLRFGDGVRGRIPAAGAAVVSTYSSGGGLAGNVAAGKINEVRTAVPYVQGVVNPVAATGGSESELARAARRRAPQMVRHRDRAVSLTDIEWIAREASPAVSRVRCLPLRGPAGFAQRGWVTVAIAPAGSEPQPVPTPELQRQVLDHLAQRLPATASSRIRVVPVRYAPVKVAAEIVPLDPGAAPAVEALIRQTLARFLHPLTGGANGDGWQFGQTLYLSQIASLIESAEGVDYAQHIELRVGEELFGLSVPVEADVLIASSDHELKLLIGKK